MCDVLGVVAQADEYTREEDHREQKRLEGVQASADWVAVGVEVVRVLAERNGDRGRC